MNCSNWLCKFVWLVLKYNTWYYIYRYNVNEDECMYIIFVHYRTQISYIFTSIIYVSIMQYLCNEWTHVLIQYSVDSFACIYLSIYLSIYVSIYLQFYLSIYLSITEPTNHALSSPLLLTVQKSCKTYNIQQAETLTIEWNRNQKKAFLFDLVSTVHAIFLYIELKSGCVDMFEAKVARYIIYIYVYKLYI